MLEASDLYAAAFRGEFARALESGMPAPLANVMKTAQVLSATGRWESQHWMSPVPDPVELVNEKIPMGLLDSQASRIRMKDFGSGFQVKFNDMADDQLSLYKGKPGELIMRQQRGVANSLLETIRDMRSVASFEGSATQYQAANSHTVGTGDNLLAATCTDKTSETIAALYTGGPIKPLIWYDRQAPSLDTDYNTPQARLAGVAKWWSKYRGAAACGPWWDSVFVDADGIPTVSEMLTHLAAIIAAFRTFQYPDGSYVHQYTQFDSSNLVLVASPALEVVLKQALQQSSVIIAGVQTENPWKGTADYLIYNGMDQA